MRNKHLFPQEFINSTVEHYIFKLSSKSIGIYLVLILTCLLALFLSPFVYVDVFINASGVVTPIEDKYDLRSPATGKVVLTRLEENMDVSENDTLVILDNSLIINEIAQLQSQFNLKSEYIADIGQLLTDPFKETLQLKSRRYQLENIEFLSSHEKLLNIEKNAEKVYQRQKKLFEAEVISEKEFESDELKYKQAKKETELFTKAKKTDWQQVGISYRNEQDQLVTRLNQLKDELQKFYIIAPASGTLQNVYSTEAGQYLNAGANLAEISPETNLIATCWVSPSDIGLLETEQKATFRIDAFNSSDWGTIEGKIIDISNDAYFLENRQTAFRVKCELESKHLSLKNGFKGYLKKGMTLQSNFKITTRSLYQLLFDKVDDWLNPSRSEKNLAPN